MGYLLTVAIGSFLLMFVAYVTMFNAYHTNKNQFVLVCGVLMIKVKRN